MSDKPREIERLRSDMEVLRRTGAPVNIQSDGDDLGMSDTLNILGGGVSIDVDGIANINMQGYDPMAPLQVIGLTMFVPFAALYPADAANMYRDYSTCNQHLLMAAGSIDHIEWDFPGDGAIACPHFLGDGLAYFKRAAEASLQFSNIMAIGGWFKFGELLTRDFYGRIGAPGNWSYGLQVQVDGAVQFYVSSNGTAYTYVESTVPIVVDQWYYIVGSYVGGEFVKIYVNNTVTTNTTSIPATIHAGTAALELGGNSAANNYCDMYAGLPWLALTRAFDGQQTNIYTRTRSIFGV